MALAVQRALAAQTAGLNRRQLLPAAARPTRSRTVIRRYKEDEPQQQAEAGQAAVSQPEAEGGKAKVVFQLPHHVEFGQDMCLVGEDEALGAWDVDRCVPMAWHDGDVWTAEAELPQGTEKIEYKYIVRQGNDEDECVRDVREWQPCMNLAVQVDGSLQELTVKDAWEGSQHEVLPGILPVPVPVASEPVPEPAAAELTEVAAATPAEATPAAPVAAVAADDAAAVDVEALLSGSSSDEGEGPGAALPASGAVMTAEQIAAATPDPRQAPAAAAGVAAAPVVLGGGGGNGGSGARDTVHAGADGNILQHISEVRSNADATVPAWLKQAAVEAAEDMEPNNMQRREARKAKKTEGKKKPAA